MDVRGYVESHAREFFADLKQWLAIPSISADPARHPDVRRSAEWLAAHLRDAGFPVAEVWETGGLPAVFAEWRAVDPAAPAVLIYGHHDVQPVDPLAEWDSPPVTIKLLVEGEEESGSEHFAALLRAQRPRLACDVLVIGDATMWAADVPSMCTGLRGLASAEVTLTGPGRDLHSGSFGGGVPNPLHALAGLHDEAGRVTLPGFCDRVLPLSAEETDLLARLPFDEKQWLAEAGGSGPEAGLADILGAPLVFMATSLNSDRLHAPNEQAGTAVLLKGAEAAADLWAELAAISADLK